MPEYYSGRSRSSGFSGEIIRNPNRAAAKLRREKHGTPELTPQQRHQRLLDEFGKRVVSKQEKIVEADNLVEEKQLAGGHQRLVSPPLSGDSREIKPGQLTKSSLIVTAEQAYQQQNYATAYDLFSEVVKKQPNDSQALYCLSVSATKTGNHTVAIATTQKLINSGQYTAQAAYYQGISLEQLNRQSEALIAYKQAGAEIPEAKSAFMRLEEERLLGAFSGQVKTVSAVAQAKPLDVADFSSAQKLTEAVTRSFKHLPAEVAAEIKAVFTPATLATMVGVFAVYLAAHATGIGQAIDIGMLIAGGIYFGLDAFAIFKDIAGFAGAVNATSEEELDRAGEHLASAIAKIGVDAVMTLLTKKVADEIGKGIDRVNQVDEVHAHHDPDLNAGDLDNAEGVNASQVNDVDNVSQINDVDNAAITSAQQLINAGYNSTVVNTLLPVLGREGVERLYRMDMFSFAPERMDLINSGYGQTVRNLPDLKNKPRVEIETLLDNSGFDRPTVGTTSGQEMWLHPDGSVVRMKLGPAALKNPERPTEHLVREISRKQPANSRNRDIFAKVAEDGSLIPAGPKFAKDQLQQWFKRETGRLPNEQELDELARVWADAGHIEFQP